MSRKNKRYRQERRVPRTQRRSYLQTIIDGDQDMTSKKSPMQCEQATNAVQGCGDPTCSICLPLSDLPSSRGASSPTGRVDNDWYGMMAISREEMRRTLSDLSDLRTFGIRGFSITDPEPNTAEQETEAKQSRLLQAERNARGPIKQYLLKTELHVDWRDIVGNEEAHRAMLEAIEFPIKHKELFEFYGKKTTKGILLSGPPGCGKTMFGKAAASVIGKLYGKEAALLSVKASELQKPYVGQTEEIIRQLFAYARAYKNLHGHQLVLFIDEADAILPNRSGTGRRAVMGWEESNVATFLSEMDGMEESGALVILATNRPEAIDGALLREGRIDRKIVVRRPDAAAARSILYRAFDGAPLAPMPVHFVRDDQMPSLDMHHYLCDLAINELFSPMRHIVKVKTDKGLDYLTLGDCVSGAMVVGLVERAKANAFHRDISVGTMSGIGEEDVMAAVEAVMKEQYERPDIYALTELAQRINAPVLELDRVQTPELKFTGTLQ